MTHPVSLNLLVVGKNCRHGPGNGKYHSGRLYKVFLRDPFHPPLFTEVTTMYVGATVGLSQNLGPDAVSF